MVLGSRSRREYFSEDMHAQNLAKTFLMTWLIWSLPYLFPPFLFNSSHTFVPSLSIHNVTIQSRETLLDRFVQNQVPHSYNVYRSIRAKTVLPSESRTSHVISKNLQLYYAITPGRQEVNPVVVPLHRRSLLTTSDAPHRKPYTALKNYLCHNEFICHYRIKRSLRSKISREI